MSSAVCSGVTRSECRTILVISILDTFPLQINVLTPADAAAGAAVAAFPVNKLCDIIGGILNYPPRFRFLHLTSAGHVFVECEPEFTGDVIKGKLEAVRRALCGNNAKTNET